MCVDEAGAKDYVENKYYRVVRWNHYEIIKPKTWRPFKNIEEFKEEFIKRDARIIHKVSCDIYSILYVDVDWARISDGNRGVETLFYNYTWLDGSPIGVEE